MLSINNLKITFIMLIEAYNKCNPDKQITCVSIEREKEPLIGGEKVIWWDIDIE